MTRRQTQIPGTERKSVPEVEEAALGYIEARDERMTHTKREKQKKLELLAVMRAHRVTKYKFDDAEGEELMVSLEDKEPDVSVRKTGDAEAPVGEGMPTGDESTGPHQGLIAQAMRDQETGVEVTNEGDVVVPDKAAPKKPRKGKKGGKS